MSDLQVIKIPGGVLKPAFEIDARIVDRWPINSIIDVKAVRPRNNVAHKKFFALLKMAFENWEPRDDQLNPALPAMKSFDRFRSDVTIVSGYYDLVYNIKNELRYVPRSIAFANMSEDDFADLYDRACRALLKYVLQNYTRADLDIVVERYLSFT